MDQFSSADAALSILLRMLRGVGDDDLGRPTPCRDFDVADLGDHLVDTVRRMGEAAGMVTPDCEDATLHRRTEKMGRAALQAWHRRGLTGDVVFAGRTMPARTLLSVLSLELLVHAWDFAVAMQRPLDVSDAHADYVLALAKETITAQTRLSAGFDDPVAVAAGAAAMDRLVAFTGRPPVIRSGV